MASLVKSASKLNDKRKRASATQEDEDDNPSALAVIVAEGSSKKVKRRKDKVRRLSPGCSEVRPRLGSY